MDEYTHLNDSDWYERSMFFYKVICFFSAKTEELSTFLV